MARSILVTSALPYSNGPIHIGHLAGAYLPADIYVRYQRLAGSHVVFICGADEHGVANMLAARQQGITPQQLVDKYFTLNRDSFARLGIVFDNFSRTSLDVHHKTSQEFFLALHKKGMLTVRSERQLYCPNDQMFLAERYVRGACPACDNPSAQGDQCEKCGSWLDPLTLKAPYCALCGSTPEIRETTHWYLPMGSFQAQLETWLGGKKDWKDNVLNYCNGWFREGLKERAITRDLDWGIPVPLAEAKGKVLYVWFEAPIGYISSTKEWAARSGDPDKWRQYWCNPDCELVHFIGKDNIVFHAIFWPAVLMGVGGYNLPTLIPANEFLNLDGRKLSTSQNYAVWLPDYLATFPPDLLRYTIAANLPETKDGDFSWKQFQACNNDELADILGNFVNRTLTFVQKHRDGVIPPASGLKAADQAALADTARLGAEIGSSINACKIRAATARLMEVARVGNRYFDASQPWLTRVSDEQACSATLHVCCQIIRSLAVFANPFMPFSAAKLWKQLGLDGSEADVSWAAACEPGAIAGRRIGQPEILFRKLEDAEIQPEIDKLNEAIERMKEKERSQAAGTPAPQGAPPAAASAPPATVQPVAPPAGPPPQISLDDFAKVDLRIAKVLSAEKVPKADKLLKLRVTLGTEERTVVAGIAQQYSPEELVGRRIVLVANLKPAKLRGVESQGMILAASEGAVLAIIGPDKEIALGCKVK